MFKDRVQKAELVLRRAYYQLTHVRDAIKALKRGGLSPAAPKPRTYKPPSAETIKKREVSYGSLFWLAPLARSVGNLWLALWAIFV